MSGKIYDEIYSSGYWTNIGPATYMRYLLLKKITKWSKSDIVLDAGCGSGRFILLLSPLVKEIHGIDISKEAIKIAKSYRIKNAKIIKGNVLRLPYKKNFFDKVICIDVIEHIKDDKKLLSQIRRVLKDEGEGIIYFVSGKLNSKIGHVHSYNLSSIKELIRSSELKIDRFLTHRTIIDKMINPLRKPMKTVQQKRINLLAKILAYLMYLEQYILLYLL